MMKIRAVGGIIGLLVLPSLVLGDEPARDAPKEGAHLTEPFTHLLLETQAELEKPYQECFAKAKIAALKQCRIANPTMSRDECRQQTRNIASQAANCLELAPAPAIVWQTAQDKSREENIPIYTQGE